MAKLIASKGPQGEGNTGEQHPTAQGAAEKKNVQPIVTHDSNGSAPDEPSAKKGKRLDGGKKISEKMFSPPVPAG
jgi:hypothetical protein